jgi:Flp pilus assembly protein TadD
MLKLTYMIICMVIIFAGPACSDELSDHMTAGKEYIKEQNWSGAAEELSEALKLDRNNLETKLSLGYAYHMLGRLDEAEKIYKEILQAAPQNFEAYYYLGKINAVKKE